MKTLRIAMLMNRYLPIIGGAEMFASRLSHGLTRRGHTVEVITRRVRADLPAVEVIDGIPVRRLKPVGLSHLANALMVGRMFWHLLRHGRQYDVWHVHGIGPIGLAALLASRITGVPIVMKLLDYGNLSRRNPSGVKPSIYSKILHSIVLPQWLWKRILQQISGISIISEQIKAEAESMGLADKTRMIPNGVDVTLFTPVDEAAKQALIEQLGLPHGKTLIMFSGRLVVRKRADVLLAALPDILHHYPDCHVVLCGSGALQVDSVEDDLRVMVKELNIEEQVTFAGAVTNIQAYLQAADVFAFTSQQEGLPVALMEAMAAGLPIVASEIKGVTDLLDADTGWLVPVGDSAALTDAMLQILAQPDVAQQKAQNARQRVMGQFSIDATVDAYLGLYMSVI